MKGIIRIRKVALIAVPLALFLTVALPLLGSGTSPVVTEGSSRSGGQDTDQRDKQEFPVPLKPLPLTITPCRACHGPEKDFKINWTREEALLVHRNIHLNHGGIRVWCLDCHHPENRNYLLPLSDGKLITFEQSYLLCGKCHGTKFRDWRNGIHGKRTGYWNGEKQYFLCVNCHDPHTPRFKLLAPMPPPEKPWTPRERSSKSQ